MNNPRILIPVGLGVIAAFANFIALSGGPKEVQVLVAAQNLKPGDVVQSQHLGYLTVNVDDGVKLPAVPVWDRGELLKRRVNRSIKKGQFLLYEAVEPESQTIQSNLRPGEHSLTLQLTPQQVPANFYLGQQIGFLVEERQKNLGKLSTELPQETRVLGPFRLVGQSTASKRDATERKLTIAVSFDNSAQREEAQVLERALRGTRALEAPTRTSILQVVQYGSGMQAQARGRNQ